ncbi:hypothetical protein [Paracoccus pantotrophus]|uniref:hypothetical protein n=1 Tax=Paracoccus pantotrophus TaxID=82367 RepID=UPI0004640B05|nr:hypothetical protein [Paracoccus pantotrophus]
MIDDLIERLRECAECKSSEAWGRLDGGQDLCIGAALATEAAAELARLRAEVERLTAALADERAHADALAEALTASTDELMSYAHSEYDGVWSDEDFDMIEAPYQAKLFQHRARRQG